MKRILYILLILMSGVHGLSNAQTTIKISELPAADSAIGSDQVPVNQGGTTKRITVTQIRSTLEPALGNPASSGYCLKSTDAGVRSWGACTTDALPSQTGNNGKFLTTNGTITSWGTPADDQTDAEVSNTSTVSGATVKAALDTLDAGKVNTSDIIGLSKGGTGAALGDPGYHGIIGWDNTNNEIDWFQIGTGLEYDQVNNTLKISETAGLGDVSWDGGANVPVDNEICRYNGVTGTAIQANTGAALDDDGSINIPDGATFKINGTAHTHDYSFDASAITSGQLDLARLPACGAQYEMLVCNGSNELEFVTTLPIESLADTIYFYDTDTVAPNVKKFHFDASSITGGQNRKKYLSDKANETLVGTTSTEAWVKDIWLHRASLAPAATNLIASSADSYVGYYNGSYVAHTGTETAMDDATPVAFVESLFTMPMYYEKTITFKDVARDSEISNQGFFLGLTDTGDVGDGAANGIWFEIVGSNMKTYTRKDNTTTSNAMTITTATADYQIVWTSSSSVVFKKGGTTLNTHTTNIPTIPLHIYYGIFMGSTAPTAAKNLSFSGITVE